jgi:hypothetical protein
MPGPSRLSLRALARDLGTTHQLLGHYLKRWEKWQGKEYRRQANEIRARSEAEKRSLTQWEESRAATYDRAALNSMIVAAMDSELDKMLRQVRGGGDLSKGEIRFANLLARRGFPVAQEIVGRYSENNTEKSKINLPLVHAGAAKSFRRA